MVKWNALDQAHIVQLYEYIQMASVMALHHFHGDPIEERDHTAKTACPSFKVILW